MAAAQVPRAPVPALSLPSIRRGAATLLVVALAGCGRVERAWPDGTARFDGALTLSGERDGEWTFRYPDGSLREQGRYEDGRRVGVWRQWHKDGQLVSEGERRWCEETGASEREGPWTFRHPNGTLRARGSYRAGRREGPWELFDEDGRPDLERTGVYADGALVDGPSRAPGED